jgi:hypothetical protein
MVEQLSLVVKDRCPNAQFLAARPAALGDPLVRVAHDQKVVALNQVGMVCGGYASQREPL